ncbi:MAG: RagB/SusD family nutrient uptake outer membrane protein [Alistipes sp.]|nr:RagB/SusD family nutrient uptake outer membrane protein [Alistipes sp.]
MKNIKVLMLAVAGVFALGLSSCVKDLETTPIDPNVQLPQDVLKDEAAFEALLAKCYQGLACSSSDGANGGPDINGVDGGFGQYLRAYFNLQCLTTDEATCCWNDTGLPDMHNMNWQASNQFIVAMYYRIFYQVSLCNELIRQVAANPAGVEFQNKGALVAEARALRALSYYHAVDMFGNVPFATENDAVGAQGPRQINRADLFAWIEKECKELLEGNDLAAEGTNVYGRCDKGFVKMILAKLYLNAEVYVGEDRYADCAALCEDLVATYPLADNFADLFAADNHLFTANSTYGASNEIIFAVPHDGINTTSYGGTNFLIFAGTGGDMNAAEAGISSGWGGLSVCKQVSERYTDGDVRAMFFKDYGTEIVDIFTFTSGGYKSMKFRNVNLDGSAAQTTGFVDTDFPLFRAADAYLMLAECSARGKADSAKGLAAYNAVRERAGVSTATSITAQDVLDERSRELMWEGCRRSDLVRFGQFTTADYVWEYKGSVKEGAAVADTRNLFPLPPADVNANSNLKQNAGY